MNKFVKKAALMIPAVKKHYLNVQELRNQIENLPPPHTQANFKYYSCPQIEGSYLHFLGNIGKENNELITSLVGDVQEQYPSNFVTFCCEPISDMPGFDLGNTAQESFENFIRYRKEFMAESVVCTLLKTPAEDKKRNLTSICAKCQMFSLTGELRNFDNNLIHFIGITIYPSPCQCKCIYCGVHNGSFGKFDKQLHSKMYEKMFDMLDYVKKNKYIASDAHWHISSGEITIHPYRDKIYELTKEYTTKFSTNCFVFDENIAKNLRSNPKSSILYSIDAGTPETYQKIKGVNNFSTIINNLKYYRKIAEPEQIELKYIVIPGINDNIDDYKSLINIMNSLEIKTLIVSCDKWVRYSRNDEQKRTLSNAVAKLITILLKNNINYQLSSLHYLQEDIECINGIVSKLIQAKEM